MIGGGGKIGGPSGPPRIDIPQGDQAQSPKSTQAPAGRAGALPATAQDGFEKAAGARTALSQGPSMPKEAVNLHKVARENPAAAKQMVAAMAGQIDKNIAKMQQELAGARAALEQLGAARFSKAALEEKRAELRRRREKIAAMKTRLRMSSRKMSLLQQVAGQLDPSDLDEELERVLGHHNKLNTAWGKAHHLLNAAELFYSSDDDTPEHLKEVVKADVRVGLRSSEVAEQMEQVSPRRVIATLIARTLDGTSSSVNPAVGEEGGWDDDTLGSGGEHGRTLQSWTAMSKLMVDALGRDPLAKKEPAISKEPTSEEPTEDPAGG